MSQQMRITFISAGFKKILTSSDIRQKLAEEAAAIQSRAASNAKGGTFTAQTWMGGYGGGRWVASVTASDSEANKAESENKALSRAVK